MTGFWLAVQFLTRLPTPSTAHLSAADARRGLRRALPWFPLVGGLVAALTALVLTGAAALWPLPVAVLIALAAEARLTGAFHEDAVADYCDAMGGGTTREETLRIFADSRIGSYGALGLGLAVALRATLLLALPPVLTAPALIASGAIGRWTILLVMAQVAPVPARDGLAKDVAGQIGAPGLAAGLLAALPAIGWAAWLAPGRVALALGGCALFATWFARRLYARLGGSTGDCLGTAAYAGMLITLAVFAAR